MDPWKRMQTSVVLERKKHARREKQGEEGEADGVRYRYSTLKKNEYSSKTKDFKEKSKSTNDELRLSAAIPASSHFKLQLPTPLMRTDLSPAAITAPVNNSCSSFHLICEQR